MLAVGQNFHDGFVVLVPSLPSVTVSSKSANLDSPAVCAPWVLVFNQPPSWFFVPVRRHISPLSPPPLSSFLLPLFLDMSVIHFLLSTSEPPWV